MKKCLIYGNCQTQGLKKTLEKNADFTALYPFIEVLEVHLLTIEYLPYLEKLITEVDLFIYHKVKNGYKGVTQFGTNYLLGQLKENATAISLIGAYFSGYHPEMVYLKNQQGSKIMSSQANYHDFNILRAFSQGKTVTETVKLISHDDFYYKEYLTQNLENTFTELYNRETKTDITISPFIEKYYGRHRLFHTINHPASSIIAYLANEIFKLLQLPHYQDDRDFFYRTEYLNLTYFPIYPSVKKALNLQFDDAPIYRLKEKYFTLQQAVEKFFQYYEQHSQLVSYNLKLYQHKYNSNAICDSLLLNNNSNRNSGKSKNNPLVTISQFQVQEDLSSKLIDDPLVYQLIKQGEKARQKHQWEQTINCYKKAINLNCNTPSKIYLDLKQLQQNYSKQEEANQTYCQWLEKNYIVRHDLGIIYCPIAFNAPHYILNFFTEKNNIIELDKAETIIEDQEKKRGKNQYRLHDINYLKNENYFKFTILRNPLRKIVYVYLNNFVLKKHFNESHTLNVIAKIYDYLEIPIDYETSISFSQFIDYLLRTEDSQLDEPWRPQYLHFESDLIKFDYVGQYEQIKEVREYLEGKFSIEFDINMPKIAQEIIAVNPNEELYDKSPKYLNQFNRFPKIKQFYTAEIEKKVRTKYARDLKIYEQQFHLEVKPFRFKK